MQSSVGDDRRFEIVEFPDNVGFYRNFERILELVPRAASWVALADQDDRWFAEKLATLTPALAHASLAFCQVVVAAPGHGREGEVTQRRAVGLAADMIDNQVTGSACVFRGELLEMALPFPEPTDLAFHDHWLGVCALVSDGVFEEPEPLQVYVQHQGNVIGEERRRSLPGRVLDMVAKARGRSSGALAYLSDHRWGWRVNMARRLLSTSAAVRGEDAAVLRAFGRGRISPALIRIVGKAVAVRDAPPARAVGLILGSLRTPRPRAVSAVPVID